MTDHDDDQHHSRLVERRIRHVSNILVCNLTPFPLRDAFASALSKPTEQSQVLTHGRTTDDLDATLSRKRARRISSNSITTLRSLHSDEGTNSAIGELTRAPSVRKRTTSSASGPRPTPAMKSQGKRTSSIGSAHNLSGPSLDSYDHDPSRVLPSTLPNNSQLGLERVLKDRLVETFLAIHVLPSSDDTEIPTNSGHSTTPSLGTSSRKNGNPSTPTESAFSSNTSLSDGSPSRTSRDFKGPKHRKIHSVDSQLSSQHSEFNAIRIPEPSTVPDFLSPIHRPSTNPSFWIDAKMGFAPGIDINGHELRVELWAKIGGGVDERSKPVAANGKGKEKEVSQVQDPEWQVLEQWLVNLLELSPLSGDPNSTLHLPSNTLVITLDSGGTRFYVPPQRQEASRTRSPSPSGYASDPEADTRKAREMTDSSPLILLTRQRRRGGPRRQDESLVKSTNWQDLFKLVSLQTCIADTEVSLATILAAVDASVDENIIAVLRREISERESRIAELKGRYITVRDGSQSVRDDMRIRREQLRHRKEMLLRAREQEEETITEREELEEEVIDQRARLESLRRSFRPTRATLISTLAYIFPIELLSPPDLLYTILDVPLPIPLSTTDPAPPLSLPNHKDVNEETVATALGYAALLTHLLATYLGKGLVYPITYIGSRSLIRDGISAMVGPRMFPLFSKGVDAYRYEYGVFLLNKDIELIMAEFDLRAMDIRHTLPNLKNILLTLTDGESSVPVGPPRSRLSPVTSLTELQSLSSDVEDSETENTSSNMTPKANANIDLPPSDTNATSSCVHTPSANGNSNGSTTPTASSSDALDTTKKSTSRFLGLSSPFTGFLRYSSLLSTSTSTSATKSPEEVSDSVGPTVATGEETEPVSTLGDEDGLDSRNGSGDLDEEDRRTLRGFVQDTGIQGVEQEVTVQENKSTLGNGHIHSNANAVEKHSANNRNAVSVSAL